MSKPITDANTPNVQNGVTTRSIMADVIIAICPAAVYGCILFGLKALLVLLVTVLSAVAAEFLWNLILKKEQTVGDLSAAVTGLLLGLTLSSETPLWVAAIGSVIAIIIVKQAFGGIGNNFVNPALAARIVLLVAFPAMMTTFAAPLTSYGDTVDTVTAATPLVADAAPNLRDLFFGMHAGAIGETSAFLLLIGGLYLTARKVICPIIPVAFLGVYALITLISGGKVLGELFSGGIMLGAIFMATDHSTSPHKMLGRAIYGIGCGVIAFLIRRFSNLPEGVSYAIVFMNILTLLINHIPPLKSFSLKNPINAELIKRPLNKLKDKFPKKIKETEKEDKEND